MSPENLSGLLHTLDPLPRGVLFDYGNTLIPFGQREMDAIARELTRFFVEEIPDVRPEAAARALQDTWVELHRQRIVENVESDPRDVIRMTFATFGAIAGEDSHVDRGIAVMLDAFVAAVALGDDVHRVLGALKEGGFKVGLLSNYSLGDAIRLSVVRLGIYDYFDEIVVSADLGLVKPHPELFLESARRLGLAPEELLYVGDNQKADIEGASAVGMRTAWIREHLSGAYFFEDPAENASVVEPDLVLEKLSDLTHGG